MSQYGSLGWATAYNKTWQEILNFYYEGTTLSQLTEADAGLTPNGVMGVRLTNLDNRQTATVSDNSTLVLQGDPVPDRRWAALVAREIPGTVGSYRVWGSTVPACPNATKTPEESGFVQVVDLSPTARISTNLSNDPSAAVVPNDMVGVCEPGGTVRYYRGIVAAVNGTDGENRTVNEVRLDDYLRGVVPRESPAAWGDVAGGAGMNALRAQAVAARSYGLAEKRYSYAKSCDTQSCQVYGGAATRDKVNGTVNVLEDIRTNTAISDTSGWIMRNANGTVTRTEFTSSNGGRTAGTTFPVKVDDGDVAADSVDLLWSTVISASTFESKYPEIGVLVSVVTTHDGLGGDWGGYATSVAINGTAGTKTLSGWDFRSGFGLRAPWFETTPVYGTAPTDPVVGSILFVGDSVGASMETEFAHIVTPAYPAMNYQAVSGRCMVGPTCLGLPDGLTVVNSLPAEETPAIAVIELGYNDPPATYATEVDQMVAALTVRGVQRIIFVNMSTRRTTASYGAMNDVLTNASKIYSNVTIFDWNAHSADPGEWRWFVRGDNVHLTSTGQTELALFIRAQLDAMRTQGLLPQSTGSPNVIVGLPLAQSDRGNMVKTLQKKLNSTFKLKKRAIKVDGVFGRATTSWVRKYEERMGLPVDGVADEAVWRSLGLDQKPRNSVMRLGTRHVSVKTVQASLASVMKVPLTPNGTLDKNTSNYVREFQRRMNIRANGVVNKVTWIALMTTSTRSR
jgi:peptidoglycan hydrolase-like amidase/peptidoglycan hydrolase-like protein with peptidoglycan-binding domain